MRRTDIVVYSVNLVTVRLNRLRGRTLFYKMHKRIRFLLIQP